MTESNLNCNMLRTGVEMAGKKSIDSWLAVLENVDWMKLILTEMLHDSTSVFDGLDRREDSCDCRHEDRRGFERREIGEYRGWGLGGISKTEEVTGYIMIVVESTGCTNICKVDKFIMDSNLMVDVDGGMVGKYMITR